MLRLQHVTFSCDDPGRVAEFWAALLGYERSAAGSSWLATDPRGEDVRLLFNEMPKSETIEHHEADLTLEGLRLVYERNRDKIRARRA